MKHTNHFRLFGTLATIFCCALYVPAHAQELFSDVSFGHVHGRNILAFTVAREVNVFQYRIEGSNDSSNYAQVGRMNSKGNTMLSRSYTYELFDPSYNYYRICKVGMDAHMEYSYAVMVKQPPAEQPKQKTPVNTSGTIVVSQGQR